MKCPPKDTHKLPIKGPQQETLIERKNTRDEEDSFWAMLCAVGMTESTEHEGLVCAM